MNQKLSTRAKVMRARANNLGNLTMLQRAEQAQALAVDMAELLVQITEAVEFVTPYVDEGADHAQSA